MTFLLKVNMAQIRRRNVLFLAFLFTDNDVLQYPFLIYFLNHYQTLSHFYFLLFSIISTLFQANFLTSM